MVLNSIKIMVIFRAFFNVFSRKAIGFHRLAILFELNFLYLTFH